MNKVTLYFVSILILALSAAACSKDTSGTEAGKTESPSVAVAADTAKVQPQGSGVAAFVPFYVYQDKGSRNRYTPSGYMPTGECLSLDDGWQYDVKTGKTCVRVVYDVACSREGRKWSGVYWQNPADNWGSRKGGYDLSGATKLVFWAKGEMGGERLEEFRVGGLGANQMYQDSDTADIGPVILSKEWKEYVIDLRGKDLSYISGGFAWVANVDQNPHHCTFYLDDIRFE